MNRLWLANVEDAFSPRTIEDDAVLLPRIVAMAPRFLLHAAPGDAVVVPAEVPGDWIDTVSRIIGCQRRLPVFSAPVPERIVEGRPYSLIEAIRHDRDLLGRLEGLITQGSWRLEPYYQSPRVIDLAQALGIPGNATPDPVVREGWVDAINDKLYFKDLARANGVPVIPGVEGDTLQTIDHAIDELERQQPGPIMLRKAMSGGGLGNLSGPPSELKFLLPDWYRAGEVVVEPYLGLSDTLGSLVEIGDDALVFRGIDVQVIEECCWAGFRFPCDDPTLTEPVRAMSLRLGAAVQDLGLRGVLNIDWAVTRAADGTPTIMVLEGNFRHNGMGHILDFARRFFGPARAEALSVLFVDNVRVEDTVTTVRPWLDRLRRCEYRDRPLLIERAGCKYGILPVLPPRDGKCGVAIFGPDRATVADWHRQVKRVLDP